MEDIKIGEYVRTKDGFIDRVIIDYKGKCNNENCRGKHISCEIDYYCEEEIVKHSKDIIDLIKVGDYVNGMIVDKDASGLICTDKDGYFKNIKDNKDIKTIVTKEQFKSVEYEV